MATTAVRDSIVGDAWIQQTAQAVPVQRIIGEDGQPTGDILTGPVRLAFDNLFTLPQATDKMQNPKYGAALLFTPYADLTVFYEEYYRVAAMEFASHWSAQDQTYVGLHSPFRDQREKANFGGFTPGCIFISATSKFKPPVVDSRKNPIVDVSKVYAGVWAICAVNTYAYKDPRKKGIAFGLQSVMIIGDDQRFGGGPKDPNQTFGKVANIQAPIVRPDVAGMMPQGANPPARGAPGAPGMPPRPGAAPAIPQQAWTPPRPVPTAPAEDDDMSWNA